jgi:CheY-like chemotaxis protein
MMVTKVSEIEILLVEDNPDDLEMTLHALREGKLANRIQVARDGAEALDFIFCQGPFAERKMENGPKIILLDLKLPKVDGRQVLARIKGDPRTRKIPVIVLTSSKEQSDVMETYDLGVNSYIVKPVDFDQFVTSVKELGMYWLLLNHHKS